MSFTLLSTDDQTKARLGRITTAHGDILTPAFLPDATRAAIQYITPKQLDELGLQALVSNTLHLFLRPGAEIIKNQHGLHKFMSWDKPILTDGGGFQIYSLIHQSNLKGKVDDHGMQFQSPVDGSMHWLTPEDSQEVQFSLGSDIKMAFDDCIHAEDDPQLNLDSVRRTTSWSKRAKQRYLDLEAEYRQDSIIFAIIQGGGDKQLRKRSAQELIDIDFDGYSYGGWPVDSEGNFLDEIIGYTAELIPTDKPRYAMGVGTPADIIKSVTLGYDLFDCVMPTRNARHGTLFTSQGKLRIKAEQYKTDNKPVDGKCGCYTCNNFSRSYLRHLFNVNDPTSNVLGTIHNLFYYVNLMQEIRRSIENGSINSLKRSIELAY